MTYRLHKSVKLRTPSLLSSIVLGNLVTLVFLIFNVVDQCSGQSVVRHNFHISYFDGWPDGVYKEKILGINRQFPGPTIEASVGDVLEVLVVNELPDQNTTIHWHGIRQVGTPFEDGPSQITQCPIPPGHNQTYRFTLSQSGTYWYHAHVRTQYTEGLWGVLIVHNLLELYDYDDEIVVTLNDWYHANAEENEAFYLSPVSSGEPPVPDAVLVNGLGRYNCTNAVEAGFRCNGSLQTRPVFTLQRNKTYRIRVINASGMFMYFFSIEKHTLTVIEADGVDTGVPQDVDAAIISPAQRYSFLINTTQWSESGRFLIRADIEKGMLLFGDRQNKNPYIPYLLTDATGVIQYADDDEEEELVVPSSEAHSFLDSVPEINLRRLGHVDESRLSPLLPAPDYFDKEIVLVTGFYTDMKGIHRANFNHTFFKLPDHKPILMSVVDGEELPRSLFPIYLDMDDVVQVVINNPFFGPHPFHLHGYHFHVLGTGGWRDGNFDSKKHKLTLSGVKRDTFYVEEKSWAVIRFKADNPGVWSFHCHNEWHMLSGMVATFVVGREELRNLTVPPDARRMCDAHNDPLFVVKAVAVDAEFEGPIMFNDKIYHQYSYSLPVLFFIVAFLFIVLIYCNYISYKSLVGSKYAKHCNSCSTSSANTLYRIERSLCKRSIQ